MMKPTMLMALTLLMLCGVAIAPALAEDDWMQAMDPNRLKSFNKNNDGVVNGHDWMLMGADEKKETAIFICGNYTKILKAEAGEKWDLQNDPELAKSIMLMSSRVELCLDVFYQKPTNRKALISTQAVVFFHEELRYLEKLTQ